MLRCERIVMILVAACLLGARFDAWAEDGFPKVLSIRDRVATVDRITEKRLESLLPQIMRETGIDMWILVSNEDNLDPVFQTMIPYENWCPITQILVFYDRGPEKSVERLNVSRTNMQGLHSDVWDWRSWDTDEKESQWDCLARIVRERDPERIGINESDVQWAADGLTASLKRRLVETIGPKYAERLESAEPLSTLWLETLLDEELDLFEQAVGISHAIIAETFSNQVVTPGVTTTEDLKYTYWQKAANLGLQIAFNPSFSIRGRSPQATEKHGRDDKVIRPGDLVHCDVGVKYLRYHTDHQEWAYVLRLGESGVPETFKRILAEGNRLQDVFAGEFKAGLTGDELLANILKKARAEGIRNPRIYSHSLGYCLHEPGPLIGLPWEQVSNPGRGDVKLVENSCFTAELSVDGVVPEWGEKELRLGIEQDVAFTREGVYFLDGRQKQFHIIR